MTGMDNQADAWTAAMRNEQASLDIGAELGPADPAAYTFPRPIPEPMPIDRYGPACIVALANQEGRVGMTTMTINLGFAVTR